MSMAIYMSVNAEVTNRETYEFLAYLGDIGGLIDILKLFLAYIAYVFNQNRLNTLLTNRLFHLSKAENESEEALNILTDNKKDHVKETGQYNLEVPYFLDLELLFHNLFCCKVWLKCCNGESCNSCCRDRRSFAKHKQLADYGADKIAKDLDLLRFIRSKRAHSFGLNFILKQSDRNNSAMLALSRPLRNYDDKGENGNSERFMDVW